jgi:Bacterial Ig-like domain (group 3)
MILQRDKRISPPAPFNTGLPPVQTTEEVPHWLIILGLTAALTLLVALLRYAIDLLGVVFLIILVGFSIRTISDWLTEGESVSAWALGAVGSGLAGTAFVVMWLSGSNSAIDGIESRLPAPVLASVSWLESHGWGQRVLMTDNPVGFRAGPQLARAGSDLGGRGGTPSADSARPVELPSFGSRRGKSGRDKRSGTKDDIGVAEASQVDERSSGSGERSRTRGLAADASDVRPAGNMQTFTTVVTSSPLAAVGARVKLTAFVTASGSEAPSGVVVFLRNGVVLGTATLRGGPDGSTASLTLSSLPPGTHDIIARYPGVAGFSASQSEPVRQIVANR